MHTGACCKTFFHDERHTMIPAMRSHFLLGNTLYILMKRAIGLEQFQKMRYSPKSTGSSALRNTPAPFMHVSSYTLHLSIIQGCAPYGRDDVRVASSPFPQLRRVISCPLTGEQQQVSIFSPLQERLTAARSGHSRNTTTGSSTGSTIDRNVSVKTMRQTRGVARDLPIVVGRASQPLP